MEKSEELEKRVWLRGMQRRKQASESEMKVVFQRDELRRVGGRSSQSALLRWMSTFNAELHED